MTPPAGRNGFVFRREEERKAEEVAEALYAEYDAGKPGAVRPTVSMLVGQLQQIRNHAIARQKKKYLEALASKVLDDRLGAAMAAQAMQAAEKANESAAAAKQGTADTATSQPTSSTDAQATAAAHDGTTAMDAAADGVAAPEGEAAAEGDGTATASAPTGKRIRRAGAEGGAANGRIVRKRKRRRHDDSSDGDGGSDSDNRERKQKGAVVPTTLPSDGPTFADIAGMDDILRDLIRLVWMPLRRGCDFKDSGSRPNEAVLLYGPSGCGKTLLANAVAAEARVPFFSVSGPSLIGGISGESETNIRAIFDEAVRQAPSLIFLDAIEALAGKQDASGKGPMEMRMALTLTSCIDRLNAEANTGKYVIVLAATNKADSLDPLVRRRFGVEIAVRMPSQDARERILQTMTRGMQFAEDVDLKAIARMTPGFVGGDLQNVVKTAQRNYMDAKLDAVLRRLRATAGPEQIGHGGGSAWPEGEAQEDTRMTLTTVPTPDDAETVSDVQRDIRLLNAHEDERSLAAAAMGVSTAASTAAASGDDEATHAANGILETAAPRAEGITSQNFRDAALSVLPAAKREGFSTIPNTTWKQVGAMEVLRKKLEMSIIGPIRYPDKYAAVGQKPMGGILLWGPPGCGKTLVAKAVANESKANFISIRGPELLNKWVGESERALRELFERARAMAPCIIFFDEMDALAAKRDDARSDGSARIVNTLLTELDGVVDRTGLFVIGATNRPDIIDPALKRPGRLGESIFVGPPTAEDRVAILQTLYRNAIPGDPDMAATMDVIHGVAMDARCTGFSGADLDHLLRTAGKNSLDRTGLHSAEMPKITADDWEEALAETQPSTSLAELRRYEKLH
ncbi:ribosome biogenesis ATPase [Sporothrix brasiliensis 5110]|uniref:Ribosome biogenesis ATPase n=1 Tax=Sporothrix brasiliensis 5110 TaxID=1398154 RepID=A0A0C2F849_9PEZI|nr:ribosome biogenesis ATPase [Sporothrix brasiliensis 5110]KIH95219.1 ribosome biogenesis ATPase [Sporothrix brasiliensis 5110]